MKGLSSIEPQKESFLGSFSGPNNPFIDEDKSTSGQDDPNFRVSEKKLPKFNSEMLYDGKGDSNNTNTKDASKKSCDIF